MKGPSFNGNQFIQTALDAGASFAISDDHTLGANKRIILVPDVLQSLQNLAKYHRAQFDIPFIAITGSNGKTTTKELLHEVLSSTYKTYTTAGNFNNHIGIPLTLLKIRPGAEMAVIEMGANHLNEIASYCQFVKPTHGLITNCGKAHLEGFGSMEGVRKGKGELFDYLRMHNGTALVMWDYDYLRAMSKGITQVITYGTRDADITGESSQHRHLLEVNITSGAKKYTIHTQLAGEYNFPNVLAAVAIGKHFGIADEKIKNAIENYLPSNSRSQLIHKNSNTIILDAYNANPTSMKAAIENFAGMEGADKVLLLGGMMELGEESIAEHQFIADLIHQYKWKAVALVGGDFYKIKHPYYYFETALLAKKWLQDQNFTDTLLLIKGSRSMQMERVLD